MHAAVISEPARTHGHATQAQTVFRVHFLCLYQLCSKRFALTSIWTASNRLAYTMIQTHADRRTRHIITDVPDISLQPAASQTADDVKNHKRGKDLLYLHEDLFVRLLYHSRSCSVILLLVIATGFILTYFEALACSCMLTS